MMTTAPTELLTLARLVSLVGRSFDKVRSGLGEAGVRPALIINGVEHFPADESLAVFRGHRDGAAPTSTRAGGGRRIVVKRTRSHHGRSGT